VHEGRLLVDDAGASTASSFLTDVHSGATFGGDGTAGPVRVRNGGTIAPGSLLQSSALFRTGALTLDEGATLSLEIGGITAGAGYDQLLVTGTVSLGGANLSATLVNGFVPQANALFFVLANDNSDPITGTFAQGSSLTVNDIPFEISYTASANAGTFTGGNDVAIRAVPEPGALLMALSAIPLLLHRTRKHGASRA